MIGQKIAHVKKADGTIEPFLRDKLIASLKRAGAESNLAEEITEHIESELEEGMSTSHIYKHAFFLLEKNQRKVAFRYSLRRAIMDLGPSGFPFEDFIAALFREKGYKAETGQMLIGTCVEHEVDVVAYNENKLIVCEAKFHNQLGTKSDLKVVLYVKARLDDLRGTTFDYGFKRTVDEGWVITNTKFTSTATHYAKCNNLTLIGWNYPKKGNLQEMIEDSGLHPITCLTALSQMQKKTLLAQGIILCRDVLKNESALHSLGLSQEKIVRVFDEIKAL